MSDTKDGGRAFPRPASGQDGMSLRDLFAMQYAKQHAGFVGVEESTRSTFELRQLTRRAYQFADAMLAARTPAQGEEGKDDE